MADKKYTHQNIMDGIEGVIFDLDGTLVDSMWMWKEIDREYLGRFGCDLPEDLQREISGMSFHQTAVYFKERFNIADSLEDIKNSWNEMALYKYTHQITLKPGVINFLKKLKNKGIKTGIATSNSIELATAGVNSLGLDIYIDEIHTSCEVGKKKPEPDIYLLVASKLGVSPGKCIVFEDLPEGLLGAINAGMRKVGIYDDFSKEWDDEKKMLADVYITSYDEIGV